MKNPLTKSVIYIAPPGGAEIFADQLSIVKGVENHLVYLFKNLFSNSIKLQSPKNKPVIHIHATQTYSFLKLTFTDNGLGFEPQYSKKIFQMFRRLHGKTEYEGTGMGLPSANASLKNTVVTLLQKAKKVKAQHSPAVFRYNYSQEKIVVKKRLCFTKMCRTVLGNYNSVMIGFITVSCEE